MALEGLSVITLFKCKCHYRSCVYLGIIQEMMVDKLRKNITPSEWVLCLLYFISYAVSLQITSLVQSTLSAMAAGDASQTTPVQIIACFCVVLFYTNCAHMCNFDSCRVFLLYGVYLFIDNKVKNLTGEFWIFSLEFTSFCWAILLLVQCYIICDRACKNRLCERKLHWVIFLLISSIENKVFYFVSCRRKPIKFCSSDENFVVVV